MLLNGLHLWNAVAERYPRRKKLSRHKYMRIVSNLLLKYKTKSMLSPMRPSKRQKRTRFDTPEDRFVLEEEKEPVHDGKATTAAKANTKCLVCSIEHSYIKSCLSRLDENKVTEVKANLEKFGRGLRSAVSSCDVCEVKAHDKVLKEGMKKKIHAYFPTDQSCMDILHSELGQSIWNIQRDEKGKYCGRARTSHPVIQEVYRDIERDLGIPPKVSGSINSGRS